MLLRLLGICLPTRNAEVLHVPKRLPQGLHVLGGDLDHNAVCESDGDRGGSGEGQKELNAGHCANSCGPKCENLLCHEGQRLLGDLVLYTSSLSTGATRCECRECLSGQEPAWAFHFGNTRVSLEIVHKRCTPLPSGEESETFHTVSVCQLKHSLEPGAAVKAGTTLGCGAMQGVQVKGCTSSFGLDITPGHALDPDQHVTARLSSIASEAMTSFYFLGVGMEEKWVTGATLGGIRGYF